MKASVWWKEMRGSRMHRKAKASSEHINSERLHLTQLDVERLSGDEGQPQ
jgi:hypothetical protein